MEHEAGAGEILTYSGRYVTPLDLRPEQVDISDIAHALSMQCRFSGHVREFYSVAQHSVLCVRWLRNRGASIERQKAALLHDAAEAYLQDMARPLKEYSYFGQAYRLVEEQASLAIAEAFGLKDFYAGVKEADLALLALERQELMPQNGHWGILDGVSVPTDIGLIPWEPRQAKEEFLLEFQRLFLTGSLSWHDTNHKEESVEPAFEHDSPYNNIEVISLEDFLAGRLDRAVPIESLHQPPPNDHDFDWFGGGSEESPGEKTLREWQSEQADAVVSAHDMSSYPRLDGRHPNSVRFHELLKIAGETHDRKQQDYGKGDDPFSNVRSSENWGVDGWVGAMVRLTDKVNRLQSLRTKGFLANEGAKDSFMDIAVYALIACVLYEQAEAAQAA